MNNKIKVGLGLLTVLATPIVTNEVVSNNAQAAQGWIKNGNVWQFYNQNGTSVKNKWVGNYWLGADGKMVTNAWVDNGRYYVDGNGAWVKDAKKPETKKQGWKQEGTAWYYLDEKGIPVKNKWIGNYWLGADGKMVTNAWVDNGRYYVGKDGAWVKDAKKPETKKQGWKQEGIVWYYLDEKGVPVKNKWVGNYWLGADGKMVTSAWVDNGRYYVGKDGAWVKDAKKSAWLKEGTIWYYLDDEGIPVKNKWIGNYWLGADGKMATNAWVDNKYYYVGKDGAWVKDAKKSAWLKEGKVWYYLDSEGTPVKNKWIGNYWLGADGKMAINSWVDNNYYYVDENGLWDKNKKKLDPVPTGEHTGWVRSGSTWYYFSPEGKLVKNKWVGNYWLGANGNMETNAWVDNGRYYVGSNGVWVPAKSNKNVSALNMPQYYQWDYRWGNKKYGFGTMAQSGCVPTALAMVFNGLGQEVLPTAVADTIYNNTNEMNVRMLGTSGQGAVYAINAYGYKHTVITSKDQLIASLQEGKAVFGNLGRGIFASGAITHGIVFSGYNNGKTKVMDPYTTYNTGKWYDINTIWNQRSTDPYDNNIGGAFVAIG